MPPFVALTNILCAAITLMAVLMLTGPAEAATFSGKRIALVVGNGKYPTAPLKNPVNDARAMAKTLKELGFEVTLRENSSQRDLAAAVRQFGSSITPGSAAVFYFAGHGMQVKGRNYLVPIDADIQLEDEVPYSAIDVSLVLDKLEVGKSAVNIVILDACRNNPFARRFRSSGTGLAQMDAPVGTLIAFATAPGSVAQDGTGENGVYTKHLLESIAVPGLPVEQMFKRVRVGVAKDTNEAQVPWESSSMKGDFVFREAAAQQAPSQDKLIEEAVRAAAERAAALTAERMAREQAERQPRNDRARAEQEALFAERERLLSERERLAAENEALRRKAAQAPAPVALAAPTSLARPPATAPQTAGGSLAAVGDRWTYRYSDGYGKTANYTVRVTAVSAKEIKDEVRLGRAHHAGAFAPGLELLGRNLGNLQLREFAPYLLSLGPTAPSPDWQKISLFEDSDPFTARLAGTETVVVPAGTFQAKKLIVEGKQTLTTSTSVTLPKRDYRITIWYAEEAKRFVKLSIAAPETGWFSARIGAEQDVIELVETSFPMTAAAAPPMPGTAGKAVTSIANLAPAGSPPEVTGLPKIGDAWTYRFSDIYGKSETYTVQVTAASSGEIADEARMGKASHAATFDSELSLTDRMVGKLALREISPYLLSLGPLQEKPEWKAINVFESSHPFSARLAGTETVSVPAGKFETRKLVIAGQQYRQRNNPGSGTNPYTITLWYAPAAKRLVKARFDGPIDKETIELVEFRLQ